VPRTAEHADIDAFGATEGRPGQVRAGAPRGTLDRVVAHPEPSPDGDATGAAASLIVGPLLRYADDRRATLWVETDRACEVEILDHRSATWSVHGHHYALVHIEDLEPGTVTPYMVQLDGQTVWPMPDSPYPPSAISTPDPDRPFRLSFGSCRRSAPFDDEHLEALGADALVALAERMAGEDRAEWPNELVLLGDQVYADDPSDEIVARLRDANTHTDSAVAHEIQNFEEYTWLYHEAWTTPAVRWLFSTIPVAMIFDDHDLRDDWNTSKSWREWITAQPWWRDRLIGAYASYWVYQHLGNLSPDQLLADDMYERIRSFDDDAERTACLDEFAWQADRDPTCVRWSFSRDLGGEASGVRMIAIDSRCSRHLDPDDRRMVDAVEWAWVRERTLERPHDHVVLASTLPFLLQPGLHQLEGWDEAISEGAWGRPFKFVGERLRTALDLEHWSAFRASLDEVVELVGDVVAGPDPPASISFLSGDVHCSYTARAHLDGVDHPDTAIHQLTMSPFRNEIQRVAKRAFRLFNRPGSTRVLRRMARWAKVSESAISWELDNGPWFSNGVMTLRFEGRKATVAVDHARVDDGRQLIDRTIEIELDAASAATPV